MAFGFSSMPSAAQRAAQAMSRLPDSAALARAAQLAAAGAAAPAAPAAAAPVDGEGINLRQPQQIPTHPYTPGEIQMPQPGGMPAPQPWMPGGVNIPAPKVATGAQSADLLGQGSSYLSTIASLFGG